MKRRWWAEATAGAGRGCPPVSMSPGLRCAPASSFTYDWRAPPPGAPEGVAAERKAERRPCTFRKPSPAAAGRPFRVRKGGGRSAARAGGHGAKGRAGRGGAHQVAAKASEERPRLTQENPQKKPAPWSRPFRSGSWKRPERMDQAAASLSFLSGRTLTLTEAGLAANHCSSLVKGLMPLRRGLAGTFCEVILSMPGRVNEPTPRLLSEPAMVSSSEANTARTSLAATPLVSAMCEIRPDLVSVSLIAFGAAAFLATAFFAAGFLVVAVVAAFFAMFPVP